MTTTELQAEVSASANRTGLYFAFLQLVFALGWTTYVIYLPKLAAEVGIAPGAVIFILMLDQAIFTVTDTAMGFAADRIASYVGRLGTFVGLMAAISCAAFVALPFVAGAGPAAKTALIALIVTWSITSSALRAPPLILFGKHCPKPDTLPLGASHARLWRCRRAVALSRGAAARSRRAAPLHAVQRGPFAHGAGPVQGRAQCGRGRPAFQAPRAGKALRLTDRHLHRGDGRSLAWLPAAFQHQQPAVISALREARRFAMADAGVLDRLQHRDVSGERDRQASRRLDRVGRGRPVGRRGDVGRRSRRRPQHADSSTIPGGLRLGLHADERDFGCACDRR